MVHLQKCIYTWLYVHTVQPKQCYSQSMIIVLIRLMMVLKCIIRSNQLGNMVANRPELERIKHAVLMSASCWIWYSAGLCLINVSDSSPGTVTEEYVWMAEDNSKRKPRAGKHYCCVILIWEVIFCNKSRKWWKHKVNLNYKKKQKNRLRQCALLIKLSDTVFYSLQEAVKAKWLCSYTSAMPAFTCWIHQHVMGWIMPDPAIYPSSFPCFGYSDTYYLQLHFVNQCQSPAATYPAKVQAVKSDCASGRKSEDPSKVLVVFLTPWLNKPFGYFLLISFKYYW